MTTVKDDRPVVDLADVLKGRVAAGEPLYVTGNPQGDVLDAVTRIAEQASIEAGKPARIVHLVELSLASQYSVVMNPVATFATETDACMEGFPESVIDSGFLSTM